MSANDEVVVLRKYLTHMEADLAKSALEAAHIQAAISADDAGGMRPGLWMGGVRLLVRQEDAARAGDLLGLAQPLA